MRDLYLVSTVRVTVEDDASSRLEQMLAYISQHCDDASLASVAAYFDVHPNTVAGLVKRGTGQTFGEVVRQMRMGRALSLMESGRISVAKVSELCGYENPSNFYRVFKQSFGTTPRGFLEQWHAGLVDDYGNPVDPSGVDARGAAADAEADGPGPADEEGVGAPVARAAR